MKLKNWRESGNYFNYGNYPIFYRSSSTTDEVTLCLHGFPTSSRMYRNLMPLLAERYHVVAPDYPGYGLSSAPPVDKYEYNDQGALVEVTHQGAWVRVDQSLFLRAASSRSA